MSQKHGSDDAGWLSTSSGHRRALHVETFEAMRPDPSVHVYLTDRGLLALDPRSARIRRAIEPRHTTLVPDWVPHRVVLRWMNAGFTDLVPAGSAISDRVEFPMSTNAEAQWARAIGVVSTLRRAHSVTEWRHALSLTPAGLTRLCRLSCGLSPKQVLLEVTSRSVQRGREAGQSLETIASVLGYADASALSHALARLDPNKHKNVILNMDGSAARGEHGRRDHGRVTSDVPARSRQAHGLRRS